MAKEEEVVQVGSPAVHIKQAILDGIRKALEDLHKTGGDSFHIAFVVDNHGTVGDAHFTIK